MKKWILTMLLAAGAAAASAQDKIVKTDNSSVEAQVTEITLNEIRYKRFSNPEGPTYVLPVSEIRYIEYPNGERDYFTKESVDSAETASGEMMPVSTAPAPAAARTGWQAGDFYSVGGVEGIVVEVDDSGQHGIVMSVDQIFLPWSTAKVKVGADDRVDGRSNMRAVERTIATGEYTWEDFPAFKWCRDKGEGWYMPALNEVFEIGNYYNGGLRTPSINRSARHRFNDRLKEYGGEGIHPLVDYFTSTEDSDKAAATTHMGVEPPFIKELPKHQKFLVRAVHRF